MNMRRSPRTLNKRLHPLTALLEHHCLLCDDQSAGRICSTCTSYFTQPQHRCQTCGLPLEHHALFCGECLKQAPVYDEIFSPFLYESPLANLIADFKHKGHHFIGKGLSDTFCDAIRSHYQQQHLQLPDWVAPVPLHWWRQWQRGFNQSALFSEQISQQLGIEHFTHLKRIRATPAQKNLSREERLKNLQHCFKITRPLHGKSVAIIDDVMTTGATVNTLAKTLKQAGAGKIIVWALARTPIH